VIGSDCGRLESRGNRFEPFRTSREAATFDPGVQPEPVSPELVLIDPELARRERARLEEKAYLQSVHDMAPLRRALENLPPPVEEIARRSPWRDAATFSRRRLVPAVLMCSLLVNGFLVADLVASKGEDATQVAIRMVTLTEGASSISAPISAPTVPPISALATEDRQARRAAVSTKVSAEKGAVERKIVSLILSSPTRKLPPDFIDPATGLVKNNVQVVCTRKQRSFLCAVRLPSDSASKALYVRYRTGKNGNGLFTWYGYRRS
jgi:hypothetical protein